MRVVKLDSVDSTMEYAKTHFAQCDDLCCVHASTQTGGRGRQGRTWVSPPGNIYMTLSFPCDATKDAVHSISMLAPLTILAVLRRHGVEASLKWPNDIICERRKVGGILCTIHGRVVHVGIGLNVNCEALGDIQRLLFPAAALCELTGKTFDLEKLVHELADQFDDDLRRWRVAGFNRVQEYEEALLKERLTFRVGSQQYEGSIAAVRPSSVVLDDGTEISCGDVIQLG